MHPRVGGHRLGHRGRRGLPDHPDADLALRPLGAAPPPRGRRDPQPAPHDTHVQHVIEGADRMKITGSATLAADPQQVWDAFHDPAVLARCLPGLRAPRPSSAPDHYAMTSRPASPRSRAPTTARCRLRDPQHPGSFTMKASGAGAPGHGRRRRRRALAPSTAGGTDLTYDADASVGGVIGGVGQRMLAGVTKKMAGQFFAAVDADIAGVRVAARPSARRQPSRPTAAPRHCPAERWPRSRARRGRSYAGRPAPAAPIRRARASRLGRRHVGRAVARPRRRRRSAGRIGRRG